MSVKKVLDKVTPKLSKIEKELPLTIKETHKKFVSLTPKATGNARNKTKLQRNTISADYPYAKALEKGHSKQAPQGMVKQSVQFLQQALRKIIRK